MKIPYIPKRFDLLALSVVGALMFLMAGNWRLAALSVILGLYNAFTQRPTDV